MRGVVRLMRLDEASSSLWMHLLVLQELAKELPVFFIGILSIEKTSEEMIDNDRKLA